MITVQCTEPQTIYDLMRKHGLRCSNVWNSAVCLSARSPCTALRDHMMNIVFVNRIPVGTSFNSTSGISTFYYKMKHIKVRARREALRYKPYIRHFNSSGGAVSLEEKRLTEDLITVALYYEDTMSELSSVIEADGQFVSSHAIKGHCGEYIVEMEQDNDIILTGPQSTDCEIVTAAQFHSKIKPYDIPSFRTLKRLKPFSQFVKIILQRFNCYQGVIQGARCEGSLVGGCHGDIGCSATS
ncbi:hypothetical protein D5F01_LYC20798 [Larimichthys crocea]|uniref:Uncharacterized protein n=1 Tax=Larimichthys crocea TaxID=215358 RepID=A0A6G0HM08_LARCR|nr:hypothetical protein D5F01_LYC20798 [Larimichthys crocea]